MIACWKVFDNFILFQRRSMWPFFMLTEFHSLSAFLCECKYWYERILIYSYFLNIFELYYDIHLPTWSSGWMCNRKCCLTAPPCGNLGGCNFVDKLLARKERQDTIYCIMLHRGQRTVNLLPILFFFFCHIFKGFKG